MILCQVFLILLKCFTAYFDSLAIGLFRQSKVRLQNRPKKDPADLPDRVSLTY
jgi:hypothetical protein